MDQANLKPIAILGAGAWGTALALHLAHQGQEVRLWSMDSSEIQAMLAERCNSRFLPGFPFPDLIKPTLDLADAMLAIDDVVIAMPSIAFRKSLTRLQALDPPHLRIISATKGLEAATRQPLHVVALSIMGNKNFSFAALSGPSFAREVAAGLPTSVMVASQDEAFLIDVQHRFQTSSFRVFLSSDVLGVEIGAVTKNVIAIAVGVADGLHLGANAKSAIITQGLNEMIRLGTHLGAQVSTLIGLAGAGDLILTCTDNQSRNRRFGMALGQGKTVHEAEKEIGHVVEGKHNAELLTQFAEHHRIALPISNAVFQLLQGEITTNEAISIILNG